jgi:hypothetical protein
VVTVVVIMGELSPFTTTTADKDDALDGLAPTLLPGGGEGGGRVIPGFPADTGIGLPPKGNEGEPGEGREDFNFNVNVADGGEGSCGGFELQCAVVASPGCWV